MRIGIVGTGTMGSTHAQGWTHTPALIGGFYSLDPARSAQLADQTGSRVYGSLDELIADVDVVDVCAPTDLHREIVLTAARAGKQIICEKPLALTYAGALEMVEFCERESVPLLVAHVVRFFPEYAQAHDLVTDGAIGHVAVVRLTRASFHPVSVSGGTVSASGGNWFLDPKRSGGMMLDLMIHDFDYARWVAGEVVSVYARSVRSRTPGAPDDYAIAILKHADGAIANIEGGWAYPPPLFRTALEIAGDDGLIEHPADSSAPIAVYMKADESEPGSARPAVGLPLSPLAESPYTTEIKHFYEVLAHGLTPRVTARDGLAAVRVALAAIESARTGREVQIESIT